MSLVTALSVAHADVNDFLDNGANGLDWALVSAGWERTTKGEELDGDPGEQDRVYFSDGEDGNKALFLRVTHDAVNDRVHVRAYSYWQRGTPGTGYNVAGDTDGNTCLQLVNGPMTNWIVADKDGFAVVSDIGASYSKGFFGALERSVPPQQSFVGELAGQTPTANQTGTTELFFKAGTDFTNVEPGQYLWVINQSTTSGGANVERVQVDTVDIPNRKLNLLGALVDDYDTNALVSFDPQPVVLWGSSAGSLPSTAYGLHSATAYAPPHTQTLTSELGLLGDSVFPSTAAGLIPLSEFLVYDAAVGQLDLMGRVTRIMRAPVGALADLDDVTVGADTYRSFTDGTGMIALRET